MTTPETLTMANEDNIPVDPPTTERILSFTPPDPEEAAIWSKIADDEAAGAFLAVSSTDDDPAPTRSPANAFAGRYRMMVVLATVTPLLLIPIIIFLT